MDSADVIPPQPSPFESAPGTGPNAADADLPEAASAVKLAELEAKHAEVADAYLRAKADAENTRRRADEDVSKARKFAVDRKSVV